MNSPAIAVAALDPASLAKVLDRLADILRACVSEGASVGFVTPFDRDEARAYWLNRVVPAHAAGVKTVLIATVGGEVAGTAQLDLELDAEQASSRRGFQGPGPPRPFAAPASGRPLMREIERRAAAEGRWLLTLDTAGDAAEALYRSLGYSLAGSIPDYARHSFEDRYDATRLMYKDLRRG